jgi:4-amino-4-deoxy-L-arabinose transferase-like glycosyltransferase
MKRLFLAVLACYLLFTVSLGVVNPIFEAPDEQHHFFHALQLAEHWTLPAANEQSLARQEAAQPPLYYLLAALALKPLGLSTATAAATLQPNPYVAAGDLHALVNVNAFIHPPTERWPWPRTILAVHLLRLGAAILGMGTLWAIFAGAQLLWPTQPTRALLATALVAFLPQFQFLHAAVTNDVLIILLCSLALWQMLRLWRQPTAGQWLRLGITVGLAILTKLTGLLLLGCALPLLFLSTYRTGEWRRGIVNALRLLIPAAMCAGWLFWDNWARYGDITATSVFIEFAGGAQHFPLWLVLRQLDRVALSSVAVFGWFNLAAPAWIFQLWTTVALLAVGGALWGVIRWIRVRPRRWSQRADWPLMAILGVWPLLVFGAWLQFAMQTNADQGRLLFPALLPVALALAYGLTQWRSRLLYGLIVAALIAPPLFLMGYWLPQRYAPAQIMADRTLPAAATTLEEQLPEGLVLAAAEVVTLKVEPGETATIKLFWRKVTEAANPAVTTVEVVGRHYATVGDLPASYHGGGTLPSTLWPLDQLISEQVQVPIAADAAAPTLGRFWLRLVGVDGLWEVGTIKIVPTTWPPAHGPALAQIGDGIAVTQATASPTVVRAGEPITVTVQWQVKTAPAAELVTFVHLGDPAVAPLVQADGPARQGDYPARLWAAGEVIDDQYMLTIPPTLAAGVYPLQIGLYYAATGERLPLWQGAERLPYDSLPVGEITVQSPEQ